MRRPFFTRAERGASALLTAAALLFLLGAAALAIDVSTFYETSVSEQKGADFGCLAGAQELPNDPDTAFEQAALFTSPNHSELLGIDETTPDATTALDAVARTGEIRTWTSADGATTLEIETPVFYDSDNVADLSIMRVTVLQDDPTTFGRVLGASSVQVVEEAFCGRFTSFQGGVLPVGVGVGFGGGVVKFSESDCSNDAITDSGTGICNYLDIDRADGLGGGGSTRLAYNFMLGGDWPLGCTGNDPTCANPLPADVLCTSDPTLNCNQVLAKSGNIASSVFDGFIGGRGNYLGRLAYQDGSKPSPINSHPEPQPVPGSIGAGVGSPAPWSAESRPTSPTSTIRWNTNTLTNLHAVDGSTCTDNASNDVYFDDRFNPSPDDPDAVGDSCYDGEVDDQPSYDSGDPAAVDDYDYERPPRFVVTGFDCNDLRMVVVPRGIWGPPQNAANDRLFTIKGFSLAYVVDPIPEPSATGANAGTRDWGSLTTWESLLWEDNNNQGANSDWQSLDYRDASWPTISMLDIEFVDSDGDGEPDPAQYGNCPQTPLSPPLAGIVPSNVKLVPAP